jgi:regulator of replication initiation timing
MPKPSKKTRIDRRRTELLELYSNISTDKKKLALPLIEQAAFLEVELEDLQKVISQKGTVEEYKHGEGQYGKKVGSEVQSYNSLLKSYGVVNRRLTELLPKNATPKTSLEAFLDDAEE